MSIIGGSGVIQVQSIVRQVAIACGLFGISIAALLAITIGLISTLDPLRRNLNISELQRIFPELTSHATVTTSPLGQARDLTTECIALGIYAVGPSERTVWQRFLDADVAYTKAHGAGCAAFSKKFIEGSEVIAAPYWRYWHGSSTLLNALLLKMSYRSAQVLSSIAVILALVWFTWQVILPLSSPYFALAFFGGGLLGADLAGLDTPILYHIIYCALFSAGAAFPLLLRRLPYWLALIPLSAMVAYFDMLVVAPLLPVLLALSFLAASFERDEEACSTSLDVALHIAGIGISVTFVYVITLLARPMISGYFSDGGLLRLTQTLLYLAGWEDMTQSMVSGPRGIGLWTASRLYFGSAGIVATLVLVVGAALTIKSPKRRSTLIASGCLLLSFALCSWFVVAHNHAIIHASIIGYRFVFFIAVLLTISALHGITFHKPTMKIGNASG